MPMDPSLDQPAPVTPPCPPRQGVWSRIKDKWPRHVLHLTNFGADVIIAVVIAAAAASLNDTGLGKELSLYTYRVLQKELVVADRLKVVVIDISELPLDAKGVTPRQSLRNLLESLSDMSGDDAPAAVGIDIDMSPKVAADGSMQRFESDDDLSFFKECLSDEPSNGAEAPAAHLKIPVVLGIYRTQALPPSRWLLFPKFQPLAASLLLPNDARQAVESTSSSLDNAKVPAEVVTLSGALARKYRERRDPEESMNRPFGLPRYVGDLLFPRYKTEKIAPRATFNKFWIDFSVVERLRRERVLLRSKAFQDKTEIKDYLALRREDLARSIVLIGDVSHAQQSDIFVDPVHVEPISGVLIHAAATYTQAMHPLYSINEKLRPLVDFFLALAAASLEFFLLVIYNDRLDRERFQGLLAIIAATGVILFGIFVNHHRIIWDDFILVAIVTLLHPALHHHLHRLPHKLRSVGRLFLKEERKAT